MVNKLRVRVILFISILSFNLLTGAESPVSGKHYSKPFLSSYQTFQNSNIFSPKAALAFSSSISKSDKYGNVLVERGVITAEQMGTLMTQDGGHDELISLYDSNKQAAIEGGPASQKLWEASTNKAVEQLKSEGLNIAMGGQSQGGFFNDLLNSFQQSMGYATDGNGGLDENGAFSIKTCFTAGTLVHTKTGTKKIEEIQVGDIVASWNEKSGEFEYNRVLETYVRQTNKIYKLTYENGRLIETTNTHPFYVESKGWIEAEKLRVGDKSLLSNENTLSITSIEIDLREETVYNFQVENAHTYFVSEDSILVHNADYGTIQNLAAENGYVNGVKTYTDEHGHTVTSKTMGDKGIYEVVDLGGGNKMTRLIEVDEYGLVRKQEFNSAGKLIESKTSYVQDGILENLTEAAGHLTTGLPATIVSGLGAFLDLTLGNGIVAAHNLFTGDQNDWKYAIPYIGGPNGENDFIGIANSSLPAIAGSRGMGGGPFAFFNSNQGNYQEQFHNNWGTQEGGSAKPLATHEVGHVTQSWNPFQNPLAFFYPLYAPIMTKYNNQNNPFEKQADKIGENNNAKEKAKALEAIFGGYRP